MSFASQNLTMGQMNAVIKKLGGEDEILHFLRGELVVNLKISPTFPAWRTVILGQYSNVGTLRAALDPVADTVDHKAYYVLLDDPKFTLASEEIEARLIVRTVEQLGLVGRNVRYSDICARAIELGLELCPAEVGPVLWLKHKDSLGHGEPLNIAMEPLGSAPYEHIFRISSFFRGRCWLEWNICNMSGHWKADSKLVFMLPRKR